jgi:hypothetical protein
MGMRENSHMPVFLVVQRFTAEHAGIAEEKNSLGDLCGLGGKKVPRELIAKWF